MTTQQRMTAREEAARIVGEAPMADVVSAMRDDGLGITISVPVALHRTVEQTHGIDLTRNESVEVDAIFRSAVRRRAAVAQGF